MIVDCFLYNGEEKMLNFRLHELNDYVNYFVICESPYTFSGRKRELKFNINKFNGTNFKDKIIYIVYNKELKYSCWDNEQEQRNFLIEGIIKINVLLENDIIMLSDIDEIPDLNLTNKFNGICNVFNQDLYYYNINSLVTDRWNGTLIFTAKFLVNNKNSLQALRMNKDKFEKIQGGWHFSYFGDVNFIINKIESFSHQEFNNEKYKDKEKINELISNHKDLFYRDNITIIQGNKKYLPKHVHLLLEF